MISFLINVDQKSETSAASDRAAFRVDGSQIDIVGVDHESFLTLGVMDAIKGQ